MFQHSNIRSLQRGIARLCGLFGSISGSFVYGQAVTTTWQGGTGLWPTAAGWTNGIPNAGTADAMVDNQPGTNSILTMGSGFSNVGYGITLGRLRINSGDTVQLSEVSTSLTMADTGFPGAGEILINGTLRLPGSTTEGGLGNRLLGTKVLNGTGKLLLGQPGRRPEILGNTTNNTTIEGTAFFGRSNSGGNAFPIFNTGLVNANVTDGAIHFATFGATNSGTMQATNGATLRFTQGDLNNTGGLIRAEGTGAPAGSSTIAEFGGRFVTTGGKLSATAGGKLRIDGEATWKDLSATGPTDAVGILTLDGTVTNDGVITISAPQARLDGPNFPAYATTTTLASTVPGVGEVVLNKAISVNGTDTAFGVQGSSWRIQGQTIRGRGEIGRRQTGFDAPQMVNRGTLLADRSNEVLSVSLRSLDNQSGGFLRATGGGILDLGVFGPLLNTGGTIEATTGGQIVSTFGRIHGGLVRNVGGIINLNGMTLVNPDANQALPFPDGGMTLQGSLTIEANQTMRLVNEISNEGTLRIRSNGLPASVTIGEDAATSVTLTGNGDVNLGDLPNFNNAASFVERFGGATLTISANHIHGFGNFGTGNRQLTVLNRDTVSADAAGRSLFVRAASFDNTQGALRAKDGGVLQLAISALANTGSLVEAQANSAVRFEFSGGSEVTGGTLKNANNTFVEAGGSFELGNATLVNLAMQGAHVVKDSTALRLVGTIENNGSLKLTSSGGSTNILVGRSGAPNVSLNGSGETILTGPSARIDSEIGGETLTLGGTHTLRGNGIVGLHPFPSIQRFFNLVNNATIDADSNALALSLVPLSLTNSPGKTMKATNGGILYMNPEQLTNTNAFILAAAASTVTFDAPPITGGTVTSAPGGKIRILNSLTASGGIEFKNGGETEIGGGHGGTQSFAGLANGGSSFVNTGTVTKVGGGDYSMFTALTNISGSMVVNSGTLRWFGGGTIAKGNFSAGPGSQLTLQGALPYTISGTNTMSGAGLHWMACPITLADATDVTVSNLNLASASVTGLGAPTKQPTLKISSSGSVRFHPSAISLSGVNLINDVNSTGLVDLGGGPPLTFTNNAKWENSGIVTMSGYINTITGDASTLFTNTPSGILRAGPVVSNTFDMHYQNSGVFDVVTGILPLKKNGTFDDGSAMMAAGTALEVENSTLTLKGSANNATGLGFLKVVGSGSLSFNAGAKLNADRLQFNDSSSASGPGEVNVAKELNFQPNYSPSAMDGVRFNLAAGGLGLIQFDGGTLRFQNGAQLRNSGQLSIRASSVIELNTNAVLENNGMLNVYDSPTLSGDGTGWFKTSLNSETHFYTTRTVNLPFDFAGRFNAENGTIVTFNKGGVFNQTAKISPNHPASEITFTGAGPYRAVGNLIEFPGTGFVNFKDTSLLLDTLPAQGQTPAVLPEIAAGARVAFFGSNSVRGAGSLTATGFVFQAGALTVDATTLRTFGTADTTLWASNNGTLTLQNGARFLNDARFVIQQQVGSITGDSGTLFHNMGSGRVVHDTSTTTNFDVPFYNEGFLEFSKGTINFLKTYSGNGGVAASGGAKVDLGNTPFTDSNNLPRGLQASGVGSEVKMRLSKGQTYVLMNADALKASAGGRVTLTGGSNVSLSGGGSINATGPGSIIESAVPLIGNDSSTLKVNDGSTLIGNDANTLIGNDGNTALPALTLLAGAKADFTGAGTSASLTGKVLVDGPAAGILVMDGAGMAATKELEVKNGGSAMATGAGASLTGSALVAAGAGNILGHNGGTLISTSPAGILSHNGGTLVAAGGGNLVAAGGGNLVAAGAGNVVAARSRNSQGRSAKGSTPSRAQRNHFSPPNPNSGPAGMASWVAQLNSDPNVGLILLENGGTATIEGIGSIVAESGGILAGVGTFSGPGFIKNGGTLSPGISAGVLTWTGNLTIEAGGLLEVELAGTTANTQYDVLNVSGSLVMNGTLGAKLLGGFGSNVQPADIFDVVTAGAPITTALAGTRVPAAGSYGTFEVQLVNGGRTLRLTNFQKVPVTFANWATRYSLTGANAASLADPNGNGLANLLEYALGLDPNARGGSRGTSTGTVSLDGKIYQTFSYTKPAGADTPPDITYQPERAPSLPNPGWSSAPADLTITTSSGPGSLETVTIRSNHPITENPQEFLRLKVILPQ